MTLRIRKSIVVCLVASLFLLGNLWLVVGWLDKHDVIGAAQYVRHEYLTGTAITIIVVLLIMLVGPSRAAATASSWFRKCPVCDERLVLPAKYCWGCGSKV